MPSFDVQVVGAETSPWTDSRVNPNPSHPHTYRRLDVTSGGGSLVFNCVVGGVVAPLDSDTVMAGRTFTATIARWSGDFPPVVTQAAGQSSKITVALGQDNRGHHQLLITLSDDGGSIGVPFDGYWSF